MMDLSDLDGLADAQLPVAAFRAHLRLGTGFADDTSLDAALLGYLRAAIASVEARTGKSLIQRRFRLTLAAWRWADAQALPVAPVQSVTSITLIDSQGQETVVDAARTRLIPDRHRPQIAATGAVLPQVPTHGRVQVEFVAGLAAEWADVPGDLQQAVMLLAARNYELRTGADMTLPGTIAALVEPWRPARLSLGGRA